MITLENRFFPVRSAVCFFVEGGIILIAVLASFLVLQLIGDTGTVTFNDALIRGVVVSIFCQSCMYFLDLYDLKIYQSMGEIFFSLIFAIGFVCIGIGLVTYAIPEFGVEGRMYYFTILFVAVLLFIWRVVFDYYLSRFGRHENILIAGTGDVARLIAKEVKKRERLGFRLVGFVTSSSSMEYENGGAEDVLGDYSRLSELVEKHKVRKLLVAITERRGEYPIKEMLKIRVTGCKVLEWPEFFEKLTGRIPVDNLAPSYFIFNEGFRKSHAVLLIRRFVSAVSAFTLGIIFFPFMVLAAVAIKIDSRGPVFYSQTRVGQGGKIFKIYKFRSMRNDAEVNGSPIWASENDPRITRVGRFIRRMRIDELPQLFNVIRGDIDIVGPRPERPEFVNELQDLIPYYFLRHTVKPGLTGWAQVMFHYGSSIEESKNKLQYDLFYIKNMSTKLDLFIIFSTVKILILGRGAR